MINKVILVGNVGQDPEVKVMQSGSKVVNFSLATSETWKDKNGEKRDSTEWHRIVVYGDRLPDIIGQYVKKGTKLYVEGSIKSRKYTDASGNERTITEIVLQNYSGTVKILDSKSGSSDNRSINSAEDGSSHKEQIASQDHSGHIDDDIPF
ncbi:single-stranded DNA-binding protein [Candidatus Deianiraea vastatrix]|uniref:Single-stranded DNA-binding protein n=1 Tax=Candidatus Deianiraea vastatrix TaxID=2163644 RepID=A0A5B8XIB4_9RICK|nr:single-stranded DNA-binding protein [Candidatus Deianiraea vastatrix]QED23744.1 Single-stranded DNA-binding protein [Candidatus Deianiraea vastatrix]